MKEQKRITAKLGEIDELISGNKKKALDVGAGTGNLTEKLLKMDYSVTAVDISSEMCAILKTKYQHQIASGNLVVNCSPVEQLDFAEGQFDLVTCYSVLHHLPDYVKALHKLSGFLKKGGVMYLDHEASPFYWKGESSSLSEIIKTLYLHSNPLLNSMYFQITGLRVPPINYGFSDYWHKKEHALDHYRVRNVFKEEDYESYRREDYYETSTWIPNPLSIVYQLICSPEMSCWVAKK